MTARVSSSTQQIKWYAKQTIKNWSPNNRIRPRCYTGWAKKQAKTVKFDATLAAAFVNISDENYTNMWSEVKRYWHFIHAYWRDAVTSSKRVWCEIVSSTGNYCDSAYHSLLVTYYQYFIHSKCSQCPPICWTTHSNRRRQGGAENDGHENAGHENDGPSCRAWNCGTWNCRTCKCRTWKCKTRN